MSTISKEGFFSESLANGVSFTQTEKDWLSSGYAIKRGKSAKDNIVHAFIAGEVDSHNLTEWLKDNGTDNDVKQASYYANRISDFKLIQGSLISKAKKAG